MPVANDVFFTPVFHLHDESPSPRHENTEREQPMPKRQRPHHSGRLLGALWMTPASGTSLSAAGSGSIVRTPRTACKSLAGRPPPRHPTSASPIPARLLRAPCRGAALARQQSAAPEEGIVVPAAPDISGKNAQAMHAPASELKVMCQCNFPNW